MLALILIIAPFLYRLFLYKSVRSAIEADDMDLAVKKVDSLPQSYDLSWTLWQDISWVPLASDIYQHVAGCPSCNADGYPLLWHAARNGKPEIMKALLNNGASLSYRGDNGSEFLRAAVISDNMGAIELLVKSGVDIRDNKHSKMAALHMTSLHTAIINQSALHTTEYLIEIGADVNATDERGRTPLDYAYTWNTNAISTLLTHGAQLGTSDWLKSVGKYNAQHAPPAGRGEAPRP